MIDVIEKQYGKFPGFSGLVRYCQNNNIETIPTCADETCQNFVTYKKDYPSQGFAQYCSPACSRKNKTVPKNAKLKLEDRDWLYDQRIAQNKSKDEIARHLGISPTPVYRYLQLHNIEHPKFVQRQADVDLEQIIDLYVNQKMSMVDISKIVNVCNVTVKKKLILAGVELRSHSDNQSLFSTNRGKIKPRIQIDRKKLVESYSENKQPIQVIAEEFNCHPETIRRFLVQEGVERSHRRSYIEHIVIDILQKHNIRYSTNRRNIIPPLELDILLEDFNMAIEINGLYTHSVYTGQKSRLYHFEKYQQCRDQGIRLLQFWENDIVNKPEIIERMILARCGLSENGKLHARKCTVSPISYKTMSDLCEKNHIQGAPGKVTKAIGLFHNNELVAAIGYSKNNATSVITRYCTDSRYSVRGGFSKLLKHVPGETIITYSHNDISDGDLYRETGFTCTRETKYDTWYTDYKTVFNRQKFMKCKLEKLLDEFDPEFTEEENMIRNGYDVIHKSGTKTWVLDKKRGT